MERPEEPFRQPPNSKFQPRIDDEYYKLNPWYGQGPKRPVFGLGSPLPHTVRRTLNNIQAEQASKQQDLEMGKQQESKKGKRQDPKKGKKRDSEEEDRSKTSGKDKDKEKPYGLGTALPHQAGSQPVSQHRPTHSLATGLPHQEDGEQGRRSRRKPQRKATVESPEETEARERQQAQLPYENQAAANPTGTEGRAPLDGDGRPQKNFDPFADFDRIGRSFDGEGDDQDEDYTKWAIDAEPVGQNEKDEAETGEVDPDELRNWWARIRAKHPEPLAEYLCVSKGAVI